MPPLAEPWSIRRRAKHCARTEVPFAEGDTYHSIIQRDQEGNWQRQDFSQEGWEQFTQEQAASQAELANKALPFSSWSGKVEPPPPAQDTSTPLSQRDPAELLHQLCHADEPHTENLRFVLALMLERSRKLVQQDSQDLGDHRILVYTQPKTDQVFLVRDPKLNLLQLGELQAEITLLLNQAPTPS